MSGKSLEFLSNVDRDPFSPKQDRFLLEKKQPMQERSQGKNKIHSVLDLDNPRLIYLTRNIRQFEPKQTITSTQEIVQLKVNEMLPETPEADTPIISVNPHYRTVRIKGLTNIKMFDEVAVVFDTKEYVFSAHDSDSDKSIIGDLIQLSNHVSKIISGQAVEKYGVEVKLSEEELKEKVEIFCTGTLNNFFSALQKINNKPLFVRPNQPQIQSCDIYELLGHLVHLGISRNRTIADKRYELLQLEKKCYLDPIFQFIKPELFQKALQWYQQIQTSMASELSPLNSVDDVFINSRAPRLGVSNTTTNTRFMFNDPYVKSETVFFAPTNAAGEEIIEKKETTKKGEKKPIRPKRQSVFLEAIYLSVDTNLKPTTVFDKDAFIKNLHSSTAYTYARSSIIEHQSLPTVSGEESTEFDFSLTVPYSNEQMSDSQDEISIEVNLLSIIGTYLSIEKVKTIDDLNLAIALFSDNLLQVATETMQTIVMNFSESRFMQDTLAHDKLASYLGNPRLFMQSIVAMFCGKNQFGNTDTLGYQEKLWWTAGKLQSAEKKSEQGSKNSVALPMGAKALSALFVVKPDQADEVEVNRIIRL